MSPNTTIRRATGFTFIEVMVSIGVFAVIATICFATLSQYLKVREGVEMHRKALQELQRAFTLVERDLRFAVNRPVRDEYGEPEPAFLMNAIGRSGEVFRVTVSEPDIGNPGRTRLRRVAWRLDDGALYRDSWQVLDRVQDSEPTSRRILEKVAVVEVIAYEWRDEDGVRQILDSEAEGLPFGAELLISMDDDKDYRRIIDLANGS